MKTWKENNTLLREAAEEKKLYWRWHLVPSSFSIDIIMAFGAFRNGKFSVSLKESINFNNCEYITFNTREEAESFAAKAFPKEKGEAYSIEVDDDYFEVNTKYGKCLASYDFLKKNAYKLETFADYSDFMQYLVTKDTENLAKVIKKNCKYELTIDPKTHSKRLYEIREDVENIEANYDRYVAESVLFNYIKLKSDPVEAYLYLLASEYPEEFDYVAELEESDWSVLYKRVVRSLQKSEIGCGRTLSDRFPYADANLM